MHLAADVRKPRKAEAVIQMVQQREIDMPAVKAQIELLSPRHRALKTEIGIIGQVQAEKIQGQIRTVQEE